MSAFDGKELTVIGTMSGTSFDGVDAAVITTNGVEIQSLGPTLGRPYPDSLRRSIREIVLGKYDTKTLLAVENEITSFHAEVINSLKLQSDQSVDLVGFHGQTIFHDAGAGTTWQLANPSLLNELTGLAVVADFRRRDLAAGGQGAPLVPLYHKALFKNSPKPVVVLNLGGVGNLTYLGENDEILAFDTGPGCALIDDLINSKLNMPYDDEGKIAASGELNHSLLDELMTNEYFDKLPPKSLDRNQFSSIALDIKLEDALATLAHFTAKTVAKALDLLPKFPLKLIVCGGGRYNNFLMKLLAQEYKLPVQNIDELNFNGYKLHGSFIEAQAFGFLAARSFHGLALSLSETTGVRKPVPGGGVYL